MSKYYSSSIAFGANQTKTERVVVSPTKIGDVTTDAVSGALTVDEVPTLDSLNPVSSDGVARAVIQAGAELPTRGSSDTGKVLTVKNSDGDLEWDAPATVTVDQTYDSTSTNAQSGVAVAEAIAAIPAPSVDEVPTVESTDDGKVLTASYSGGQGSYSWQTAQGGGGGGASYTASAPIAIESDVVKIKYTNDFALNWKWQPERVTGFDGVTTGMSYSGLVTKCTVPHMTSNNNPFNSYTKFVLTVWNISWSGAYIQTSDTTTKWTIVLYKQGSADTDYAIATETYAYASVSGYRHYMFDAVTSSFTFTFTNANIHGDLSNTPLCLAFIPDPADNVTGTSYWNTPRADLYSSGYSSFYTPTGPVQNNIPTPGPTPKDTLSIQSLPDTVVDQTFNATSQKAQSGKAVASAVNTGVATAIDDAVDVDTDNVVLTGDGDYIKLEFTRVTDTSATHIEPTNLTGTANTAQAWGWWCCNLVFDLDSVNKSVDAGSNPILKITSAISVAADTQQHSTALGFSNNTTSISSTYWYVIRQSPIPVQDIVIRGNVPSASSNTLRYLILQLPAPSNTEESAQELAASVASTVSIEGWPGNVYNTKAVIPNLPAYSSADSGKVLQVQNDGTLAWVTLS